MASMPWIKLFVETLDDHKLGRLTELTRWRFVQMLLLAGECDAEGLLATSAGPMTAQDIGWRLRLDVAVLEKDLEEMRAAGLMDKSGKAWRVTHFADRQGRKQSEKREMWRERQKRKRDSRGSHASVTEESRVTHAPRVEKRKSREEEEKIKDAGGEKNAPAPAVVGPARSVVMAFEKASGIKMPEYKNDREKKEQGVQWWVPAKKMVEMADGKAAEILTQAVAQMRKDKLTIASPLSALKTFTSINGERQAEPASRKERTPEEIRAANIAANPAMAKRLGWTK